MNKDLFIVENVRLQQTEGDTWFCLNDVLEGLGDKQTSNDKMKFIREWFRGDPNYTEIGDAGVDRPTDRVNSESTAVYKSTQIETPDALNRMRPTTFINEALAHWVLSRSNAENARKFTAIVHSKILPQIRKTGSYTVDDGLTAEQKYRIECEIRLKLVRESNPRLQAAPAFVGKYLGYGFVKVEPSNEHEPILFSPTALGKMLIPQLSGNRVNHFLEIIGLQKRVFIKEHVTKRGKRIKIYEWVLLREGVELGGEVEHMVGLYYAIRWPSSVIPYILEIIESNRRAMIFLT